MSKPLRVSFIKQYMLDNPSRSFVEVQKFVEEIGATEAELEEALFAIAEEDNVHFYDSPPEDRKQRTESQEQNTLSPLTGEGEGTEGQRTKDPTQSHVRIPHVKKKYIASASLLLVLGFTAFFIRHKQQLSQSSKQITQSVMQTAALQKTLEAVEPDPVYANEAPISADKVFSFPASSITLKYTGRPSREVVGFFPYWMLDREVDINIEGLTSVNLFGLETDGKGNIIVSRSTGNDPGWEMWNDKKLSAFTTRLKRRKVKVLLTIKAFNNANIESLTKSDDAQKRFIANAVQLVNTKSLDGINIDFEYIGTASDDTKQGFVRLIANLNEELKRQNPDAKLTIDTYVTAGARADFFEISLLQDHLDAFVIMGYDIHTPKGAPGPVAPLEGPDGINGYLQSYLERVPASKLILAVPYYGYSWPSDGSTGRVLSYAEIADMSKKLKMSWNDVSQTPYFSYVEKEDGKTYTAYFENARSLGLKYDYVNAKNLQGIGIWALGYDGLNQELQQVILDKFTY